MTARIARGTGGSRRPAARVATARRRSRKANPPGLLAALPIAPETARQLAKWGGALVLLILLFAAAVAFQLPQKGGRAIGEQVGAAGFTVQRVELHGLERMDRATVYATVLDQPAERPSLAMPLIDLDAIRQRLLGFAWIREARVSRRLPDTLIVEVVERQPAAIWQHNRRLSLIDADGVRLGPVRLDAMPNLPLLIGPGAERRITALGALLDAAPRVRPLLAGATWIGERRWDLRFHTGETLSLPEGEEAATRALRRFVDMDGRRQLLGGRFVRFDMRIEDRMIVRLRPGAAGRLPSAAPSSPAQVSPGQPPQDLSRTI